MRPTSGQRQNRKLGHRCLKKGKRGKKQEKKSGCGEEMTCRKYKVDVLWEKGACQALAVAAELTEHGISDAVMLNKCQTTKQSRLGQNDGKQLS